SRCTRLYRIGCEGTPGGRTGARVAVSRTWHGVRGTPVPAGVDHVGDGGVKGPVRQGAGYVGAPQFPFPPLAKREGGSGDRIPLHRHLQDVAAYADALWKAWAPVLDGLLGREASRALREALQVAALVHDFGKAATGFQAQLLGRARPWEFRHEILSTAWLLAAAGPVDVALLTGGST